MKRNETIDEDDVDDMVDRNINRLHLLHRQNVCECPMKSGERATEKERESESRRVGETEIDVQRDILRLH